MRESLKIMLAIASSRNYVINSIDIKAAFLQGKRIDREVYLKPPKEANAEGKLWKLNKAVYGLCDASRVWYLRVAEELKKLCVAVSRYDKSLFLWKQNGSIEGMMCVHVDDFLWCGSESFKRTVISKLKTIFEISKEKSAVFKYLGIDLIQNETGVIINPTSYANSVQPIVLPFEKNLEGSTGVSSETKTSFRGLVGQLSWVSITSRPDMSYDSCVLSTVQSKPTIKNVKEANKASRELKNNDYSIIYPPLDINSFKIAVFCDASFNNLNDGGSQGGNIIFLYDKNKNSAPITWCSRKVKRVVRSTLAAETLAAVDALDSAFLVSKLLSEFLGEKENREIDLFTDNKSLYDSVNTSNLVSDKRLRVDISAVREMVVEDRVNFKWISGKIQLADVLTKKGASKSRLIDVLKCGAMDG